MRKVYSIAADKINAGPVEDTVNQWAYLCFRLRLCGGAVYCLSVGDEDFITGGKGLNPIEAMRELVLLFMHSVVPLTLEGELGEAYDTKGESLYLFDEDGDECKTVNIFTRDGVNAYMLIAEYPIAERVDSLKQSALAKLSPAEKKALGLD